MSRAASGRPHRWVAGRPADPVDGESVGLADITTGHQAWVTSKGQEGRDWRPILRQAGLSGPDRDIIVLANPEIAQLPNWVIALVAAGGLAAALSTAAGLLLVISSSVSHDLIKNVFNPGLSEKGELWAARLSAVGAVCIAGYFGINPPGFVAAVVALAFGLAAASFFPAIILGIFYKKMNSKGAITGMVVGISLMLFYMLKFKFGIFDGGKEAVGSLKDSWWFGISPEGFGTIAMVVNFAVALVVKV